MYLKGIYASKNFVTVSLSELCQQQKLSRDMQCYYEKWMGLGYVKRHVSETHETLLKSLLIDFMNQNAAAAKNSTFCFYAHTADDVFPYGHSLSAWLASMSGYENLHFIGHSLQKCASVFQLFIFIEKIMAKKNLNTDCLVAIVDLAFTPIFESIAGSTVLSDGGVLLHISSEGCDHEIIDTILLEETAYYEGIFASQSVLRAFESTYVDTVVKLINAVLDKNALSIDVIKKIYPHNVNTRSWHEIAKKLMISADKVYLKNVYFYGHCFGCDPFINLQSSLLEKELKKGDFYLLVSVGLGASYGVSLCRY